MPTIKLTDATVRNLKAKASRYEVREDAAHGNGTLALRVAPNGGKSWQYLYTFDGRDRRMTLGGYPAMTVAEAHAALGEAMRKRELGQDPGAAVVASRIVQRQAPTFADLADRYVNEWAKPRKRSWQADADMLRRDVLPHFGRHKAEAIQRKDVRALLQQKATTGGRDGKAAPIQANRLLALVRKVYNWGIGQDLVTRNPCDRLAAPSAEHQRERALSESDVQAFLSALPDAAVSAEVRLALRLQLLTAQRPGEILAVRWDEIDLAAGWWTIPGAKAKNGQPHRVPLSSQALDVLRDAKALNPDRQTVFPSPRNDVPMGLSALALAVRRNLPHFGVAAFRPHDLRRTAASHMTGMGIPRLVVSMILNHADPSVTAIYDRHSYDRDKREALDTWGRKVAGVVARARLAVVA